MRWDAAQQQCGPDRQSQQKCCAVFSQLSSPLMHARHALFEPFIGALDHRRLRHRAAYLPACESSHWPRRPDQHSCSARCKTADRDCCWRTCFCPCRRGTPLPWRAAIFDQMNRVSLLLGPGSDKSSPMTLITRGSGAERQFERSIRCRGMQAVVGFKPHQPY